jgi:hypothetical protein
MNDRVGCREMELLCRHRAALDTRHNWQWLGAAERWRELAHREAASLYAEHPGPMAMGPNTIEGDCRDGQGNPNMATRLQVAGGR